MNDLTTIIDITRSLVDDIEKSTSDIFVYSSSSTFTLTEKNVNSIISVMVNDVESGVTYTLDLDTSRVLITSSLSVDDVVQIDYNYYSNYSDSELTAYVTSALVHVSVNNLITYKVEDTDMYPEPTDKECNLVALIASIIINPQNISYRMPDIAVSVPKDLPTLDKIRKVISIYKKDGPGQFYIAESYPYYYEKP